MAADEEIFCKGRDISRSAAIICTHVASGDFPILLAIRDDPVEAADTGWQFTCGANGHGIADGKVWMIKEVLELDASILQIIDSPSRSKFVRIISTDSWRKEPYS